MNFPEHERQVNLHGILGNSKEKTELKVIGKMELVPSTLGSFFCSNLLLVLHILLLEKNVHKIAVRV